MFDAELPAIPAAAGALTFDRAGRLLILKLRSPIRRQVRAATRHQRCVYLENGRAVPRVS